MSTPTIDGRRKRAKENRENRRTQILKTALEVFSKQGYHQASISDIVQAAGVARGTFYLYFDSKQSIFHELLDELLLHLRTNIVGVDTSPTAPPIPVQLHKIVQRILETAVENQPLTQIIFRAAVGVDEELDRRLALFYANLHQFIDESLQRGQTLHLIREINTYTAARCILGSIRGIIEHAVFDDEHEADPSTLAAQIIEIHLQGLLN
jgi:AcrR family transcriptional regulator